MHCAIPDNNPAARGFTLIELAVALVVVAMILGSILVPLTTQVAQRKTGDTEKVLEDVKEALLGFAIARGRLPCPATAASNGIESPAGGSTSSVPCTISNGFVPAATLGLQTATVPPAMLGRPVTDPPQSGYAIDSWGVPIRYAVTTANPVSSPLAERNAFTAANGIRTAGMAVLLPDLYVCPSSTGIAGSPPICNPYLANTAVAVIFSRGPNGATGCPVPLTCVDEAENTDSDRAFVSRVRTDRNAANGEFDDIVTWVSPHVLYSRMLNAGQLP